MMKAQTKCKPVPGLYYRGINVNFFKFNDLKTHAPGERLSFTSFSSTTSDLRIASNFMYGQQNLEEARGVIIKIWSLTPVPISWCSFVPKECELLYNPNTSFSVLNWYEASQINLRAGMRESPGECSAFVLDASNIVHPVPLKVTKTDAEMRKFKEGVEGYPKVLVLELEEVKKEESADA
jgi:hypothetical protein